MNSTWLSLTENGAFFWDQIFKQHLEILLRKVQILSNYPWRWEGSVSQGKLHFIDQEPARKPQEWQLDQFSVGELGVYFIQKNASEFKLAREGVLVFRLRSFNQAPA